MGSSIIIDESGSRREVLKRRVIARVDELMPTGITIKEPVEYLGNELDESAIDVLRKARTDYLVEAVKKTADIDVTPDRKGAYLKLPSDFLRFVRLTSKEWQRDIELLTPRESSLFANAFKKHMAPNAHRPMAVITPWESSSAALFVMPCEEHQEVSLFYIPKLKAQDMPTILDDAVIWLAASRVLAIIRRGDLASNAERNGYAAMAGINIGIAGENQEAPE